MPSHHLLSQDRRYPVDPAELTDLDLRPAAEGGYHLLHDGTTYRLTDYHVDLATKTIELTLNGRRHHFELLDEVDLLVEQLGFQTAEVSVRKDAIAPMPGLVLDVMVTPGQEIAAGTPLLILEAMKMENVIKAEVDGTVAAVEIEKGQAVEKGQLLVSVD